VGRIFLISKIKWGEMGVGWGKEGTFLARHAGNVEL
jgi:hypothetical protein